MLFPMEKLFEQYVEVLLRQQLMRGASLLPQRARYSLCTHQDKPMFKLKPDFLLEHDNQTWVMDAKWKLINRADHSSKYGLSQADFYQLFAYGQTYLKGAGEMVLIYPKTERFAFALDEPFIFSDKLKLWVLPFDLEQGRLTGEGLANLPLTERCAGAA
jgi:5-methylcytosine-specific restriction enzyme subunit McrC